MIYRASRYLAPALTLALVALAWIALAAPAVEWKRQALRAAAQAEATYLRLLTTHSTLQQDRDAFQSIPTDQAIWHPTDGRAVTLDVQTALGQLAEQAGTTLSAVSPAQSDMALGTEALALTVELRAPLDAVLRLIEAVETHVPPLIIDAATLRRAQSAGFETNLPVVQASFRVVAATRPQPAEAAE
ncbi:hypothetical protein So717_37120 [Roseobacter cerasinus]|uniref:General secretion pathway protein M n=1 Tax=Roseobacter cerasinus TaxID=2602289 RepID=A0A640VVB4_9RHOB|nr:GspMb/PilO family protein [Roseobacter cerasinus]GFE51959.1 hypothetical protein So717_37120 [Roseobacter cerasinus]